MEVLSLTGFPGMAAAGASHVLPHTISSRQCNSLSLITAISPVLGGHGHFKGMVA